MGDTTHKAAWDAALASYRLRKMLCDADEKFGAFYEANEACEGTKYLLNAKYGSERRAPDAGKAEDQANREAVDQATSLWVRDFVYPMDAASIVLAITPAPDIDALQFKIELIEKNELRTLPGAPDDLMSLVVADAKRIAGSA